MSDWEDDDVSSAPAKAPQASSNNNDDWGNNDTGNSGNRGDDRGSFRGGMRGRGRGGSYSNRGDRDGDSGDRPARTPRPGDWTCSCGQSNFASRNECFKCHEAKPEGAGNSGGFGDSSDRPARTPRPGDWTCSCGQSNFASRSECYKCSESKPEGAGGDSSDRPARQARPGDWNCVCGQSNFASRSECFKCSEPKPEGAGGGEKVDGEKPREVYIPPDPTTDENEMFSTAISAGINFDKFDAIEVTVTGNKATNMPPVDSFAKAGLRDFLLKNVERSGYTKPTPIQRYAIPIVKNRRDLMGCAQTGSGKTAAYVLPILDLIMEANETCNPGKPQCLIIAPTRELVIQIRDETRKFANGSYVKVCLAYGGTASRVQGDNITQGCHVLVATPGRLIDFMNKGTIQFEDLRFLVLDEADRMLDMGFRAEIEKVLAHPSVDKSRLCTLLFSATFPTEIQTMAANYLKDYLFLTVGTVGCASTDVEQEFLEVTKFKKREKLTEILEQYCGSADEDRILVFVETKRTADFLASLLSETKISSTSIHGDRLQREREEALRDFRKGVRKVLIATAVAARGLDIKGVTHVINYDLPKSVDEYVHRIGRTGRVGNRGKATSFYDPENSQDQGIRDDLVRTLKGAGMPVPAFLGDSSGAAYGASAFASTDVRQPVAAGSAQNEEDEW